MLFLWNLQHETETNVCSYYMKYYAACGITVCKEIRFGMFVAQHTPV